ncbi:hypothetical protein DTO027I6_10003 [Penicillium roqueforti]|nr:hypothetical protein CBS147337_10123 [Penicillium roqueforti]KAI3184246.1 hypothetical protein DTO027I6_10003 [Penicillium roqueforti]
MPDRNRALPEPQPKRQKQEQEGEYDGNHILWKTFQPQSEQYLHHETSTTEEMQHAVRPVNEGHIKRMTQMHSEQGNLTPEIPPKFIAAANAGKALIPQPKYVEDTFERSRSTSVPRLADLYAQMIPPVANPSLRRNIDYDANCQQDFFASTAKL